MNDKNTSAMETIRVEIINKNAPCP